MKLKDKTTEQIKAEMKKVSKKCLESCKFEHKNKRYVALLNEYTRRLGLNIK